MLLHRCIIGKASYFVNEEQIKEAGSLEAAAKALHEKLNPKPQGRAKKVEGEKPEEK